MKLVWLLAALCTRLSTALIISEQECKEKYLPARLACYDTDGPCDPLPVADVSQAKLKLNELGYAYEVLRSSPTTKIYLITEFGYIMLLVLDRKSARGRELRAHSNKVSVSIIDFPEGAFVIRDDTGKIIGSKITSALDEIVFQVEGYTKADIADVKMMYTHSHFDHIGAATIVYNYIKDTWGIGQIPVIASDTVKVGFERLIQLGLFSGRAPLPTIEISEKQNMMLGPNTVVSLEPIMGHSLDDRDLIVFFEAETDQPAIMMHVDVVYPKWAPFYDFGITVDLTEYLAVHDVLLSYPLGDEGILVTGHVNQRGTREDIMVSKNFTLTVMKYAAEGLATVDLGPIAAASGVYDTNSTNYGNTWLLFDLFFVEVIKFCSKATLSEFGCQLAGLDVTIGSMCELTQTYWRVEA